MGTTEFQMESNLEKLSLIAVATSLWDRPSIKNRVRTFILEKNQAWISWLEISKTVLEYIKPAELPSRVLLKLKKTIVFIGRKIFDWIHYVTECLGFDFRFTENICWTPYGTIDEVKIFNLYWKEPMRAFDLRASSHFYKKLSVFSLACIYAQEEFINEHREEIVNELAKSYPSIKISAEMYDIMSVSICLSLNRKYRVIPGPLRMFQMCVSAGFNKASKFYWERLDVIEKIHSIIDLAELCLGDYSRIVIIHEKRCDIFCFLINQLKEEEKRIFFSTNAGKIILAFLKIWPYQELLMSFAKYDWSMETAEFCKMLKFVILSKGEFNDLKYPVENVTYFQIFRVIWEKIPNDNKGTVVQLCCEDLLSNIDIPILKLILNDPSVQKDAAKLLFTRICCKLLDDRNVGFIYFQIKSAVAPQSEEYVRNADKLFELIKVLNSSEEWLKEDFLQIAFDLIVKKNLDKVDVILDRISHTEEERDSLKNGIDYLEICRHLTERLGHFDFADRYLKWQLGSDEAVKKFKEGMKTDNFLITRGDDYIRIKSGDLSGIKPGDFIVTQLIRSSLSDFTFVKFEDAEKVKPGMAWVMKSKYRSPQVFRTEGTSAESVEFIGMKPGDYIASAIYNIWNRATISTIWTESIFSISDLRDKSTALIKFYYETDEEIAQFKKSRLNIIETENFVELVLNNLFKDHVYFRNDILSEFFKFCTIPPDVIEMAKTQYRKEIEKWLDYFILDRFNLITTEFFVNWLYRSADRMKEIEVIKNFLNLPYKCALLCKNFLSGTNDPRTVDLHKISKCLIMIDDTEKLKNDFRELNLDSPEWFVALIDMLSNNTDVGSVVKTIKTQYFKNLHQVLN